MSFLLWSAPAHAAPPPVLAQGMPEEAQAAPSQAPAPVPLSVLCQRLTDYQPDIRTEYHEGVDAHGRRVTPADLDDAPQLKFSDTIDIALTMDQAQQLGLPVPTSLIPNAYIGNVTVTKHGDVYFNDRRVSRPQIQALCTER